MQICLCDLNVAINLPGLPQIPAPATDQSCAATSSANTLIGVGYPHPAPSCANLHSPRRSRRHRLPFPAGSFIEGFRTPATVQAASLRSAGIRNPQQQRTFRNAAVRSALYQQATSHVWPKMKEAANLGRPRLIDASSLTVLNSEFPLLLQQYCISTHIGTMQRIEKPHTRQLVVLSSMN